MQKTIKFKFDDKGLIPAIIQDYKTGEVLMVAYMNRESLKKTIKDKKTWFYSRSRQRLWLKGEVSGNIQKVKAMFVDCDGDCLLIKVEQLGDAACHTGYRSCFYRELKDQRLKVKGKRVFNPEEKYFNKLNIKNQNAMTV